VHERVSVLLQILRVSNALCWHSGMSKQWVPDLFHEKYMRLRHRQRQARYEA